MKKLLVAITAFLALAACSGDGKQGLNYRGLSMSMGYPEFVDSLLQRGFLIDSAKTDSSAGYVRVVMYNPAVRYRLMLAQLNDTLLALQENYQLQTNDSTRRLWQEIRDEKEKELGAWPNMTKNGDDHREARFDAGDGFITITLENTHRPMLSVLYDRKR